MRLSPATRPTLDCDPDGCACSLAPTLGPGNYLQLRQRHPYGTRKWKLDYNRRNHVESYNASVKYHHSRLARGSTRVLGTNKTGILVALLVAANNIEVLISAYEWDPGAPNVPAEEVIWRPSAATTQGSFFHSLIESGGNQTNRHRVTLMTISIG